VLKCEKHLFCISSLLCTDDIWWSLRQQTYVAFTSASCGNIFFTISIVFTRFNWLSITQQLAFRKTWFYYITTRGKSWPALGSTEYRLMPSACRLIMWAKLWNLQFRYLVSRAPMRRRSIVVVECHLILRSTFTTDINNSKLNTSNSAVTNELCYWRLFA